MNSQTNDNGEQFVFIVGIARTGSKIYLSMIKRNTDIDIVNELHYLTPWWVRSDFVSKAERQYGGLGTDQQVTAFVNSLYSRTFQGSFWNQNKDKGKPTNGIISIKKEVLLERILRSNRTYKEILKIIIEEHAQSHDKTLGGAKFPVNIACVPTLMYWFPKAKYIHLIRDPRAVYCSQLKKSLTRKMSSKYQAYYYQAKVLFYIYNQFKHAGRLHSRCQGEGNYHLSRFEDVVGDPKPNMMSICDFLGVEMTEGMMKPNVVDSSYKKGNKEKGLDSSTLTEWTRHITPLTRQIINYLLKNEMAMFGYKM